MHSPTALILGLLLVGASARAAEPVANPAVPRDPPIRKLDGHLVDAKGRGIYTWDGDRVLGTSSCVTQCRLLWPPITAEDGAQPKGPFTLASRPDGTRQWALRGRPLYRWTSDTAYGDAGGDGVAGVWHLVKVAAPKPAAGAADDKSRGAAPSRDAPSRDAPSRVTPSAGKTSGA